MNIFIDAESKHTLQTGQLFDLYKISSTDSEEKKKTLGKVLLMTAENIHLNSFMYEPILDMSDDHLKRLYEEVNY